MKTSPLLFTNLLFLAGIIGCGEQKNVSKSPSDNNTDSVVSIRPSGESEKLYANRWIPVELDGVTLIPGSTTEQPFLAFSRGEVNKVVGSTGCNNLNGSFELTAGHQIIFSPIAATRKMCQPDGNNTERRLLAALAQATNYSFVDNRLVLSNGQTVVGRFIAEEKSKQ